MLKKTLITFTLSLLLLVAIASLCRGVLGSSPRTERRHRAVPTAAPTGTLQKMIVENGSVTMDLDLNRLNGINSAAQSLQQTHFAVGANSFFPILVFNDQLRGPVPGSMALIPVEAAPNAFGAASTGKYLKVDLLIVLAVGPEILTGSTRLKAGTATKAALNIISTGAMVGLGKVRGNLMIDLNAASTKLRDRAVRVVADLAQCDYDSARNLLEANAWNLRAVAEDL
jgi:hypothetical protein